MKYKISNIKYLIFIFYFLFFIFYFLSGNAQCTIGFTQSYIINHKSVIINHKSFCPNSDTVVLHAWDTNRTGGCLYTPGFLLYIKLDSKSLNENSLTVYENGNKIGYFDKSSASFGFWCTAGMISLLSNECSPFFTYSFKFCDKGKNGTFTYKIYDRNHLKLIASGTILGSDSCTTIPIPQLTGTARFSGAGVTNYNNGLGIFLPSLAGPGIHNIQYYWNDGINPPDSVSQTDTVNTPPLISFQSTMHGAQSTFSICPNSSGTLTAFAKGARTYQWSTNAITQSILVPPKDLNYTVSIKDSNGCVASKSAMVSVLPIPVNFLKHDTSLCNATSIILNPSQIFSSYLWQDGTVNPSIIVKNQGVYKLTVTDNLGCTGTDSTIVSLLPSPSNFLKHDTSLCDNETSIVLNPVQTFSSYLWQDGSLNPSIIVKTHGVYKLTVIDNLGCTGKDSTIVINECPPLIFVPTAFTQGDLNINNIFYAYGVNITNYSIDIFNKWGILVFHHSAEDPEDKNTGWDGKYNNNLCPIGVYLYIIHYEGLVNGKTQSNVKRGTFALLR